jgi:carbon-monoxide dehydrogenase medium subunit
MSASKLPPFEYYEPVTVAEVIELLTRYGDEARVLAGGVDLLPRMRAGGVRAGHLISIQRVAGLDYMRGTAAASGPDPGTGRAVGPGAGAGAGADEAAGIEFGAMASLHSLERWGDLRAGYLALYDAIHQITSVQTKYMGTAVGNVCVATPASDVAPALAAYDAELLVAGPDGDRRIPLSDFYPAYGRTALGRGEFATGVKLPAVPAAHGAAFLNLVRTHADIAKVTVTAAVALQEGICAQARVALGSVAPTMFRARDAEALLAGNELTDELIAEAAAAAASAARPIDDLRSTAEYRKATAEVLVARALHKAAGRARAYAANPGRGRGVSGGEGGQ